MIAAIEGRSEIIKLLVSHNASTHHTDDRGCNALTLAVTAHHIHDDTITLLLQHSRTADINTADINTALSKAAGAGKVDNVTVLLQHADTAGKNTALSIAADAGHLSLISGQYSAE